MREQQHMVIARHAQQHAIARVNARAVAVRAVADEVQVTGTKGIGEVECNEATRW